MSRRRIQPLSLALAIAAALSSWQAGAQEAASAPAQTPTPTPAKAAEGKNQLDTVIVTAQRKKEDAKDVPVSETVMKPEQLETIATAGQDVRVLAGKVPSLNIESSNGRTFPRFYIRGYGNTDFSTYASQPVSLIYDEVVQENPVLKGFPIFDLENVEVLRGPQGTLFGRNTPAGLVKFSSAKPSQEEGLGGYINASWGSRATVNVDAALNVPLSKDWAARVSVQDQRRGDWVTINSTDTSNLYNGDKIEGYDDRAARVQFLYKPDADFSALFNVHGRDLNGSARAFRANIIQPGTNDFVAGFNPETVSTNGKNEQTFRAWGSSANLSWDLGQYTLSSITGYETITNYFTRGDIDGGDSTNTPFPVETAGNVLDHHQVTQEFRVASKFSGPLNYQAGVYFFNEYMKSGGSNYNSATGLPVDYFESAQTNNAWAVFASMSYELAKDLTLRGGVRYTNDKKTFDLLQGFGTVPSKTISGSKVTGDLSLNYRLSPDTAVYGRVATGFRGASFGSPSYGQALTYAVPETTTNYELGVKSDLLNHRARVAFSVYDYDVKNQQLTAVGGASNVTSLINAKKTHGQGWELEGEALVTDSLKMTLGVSNNKTEIEDPTLSVPICGSGLCHPTNPVQVVGGVPLASINGNSLPQAPKWTVSATARYGIQLDNGDEIYLFTDWSYRSKINFFLYDSVEFTGKALLEGGLKLGYRWGSGKYEASVFCRNCTNQIRITGGIDFNNLTGFINDPRTTGVQFRTNF
ncbi:MAG TPA: TonB-dependent receptor [Burkholderiaceae bacterium]|jgi:iron complex outermembrane receptor protein